MTTDKTAITAPTLAAAATRFLDTLPPEEREKAHADVLLFVGWFGRETPLSALRIPEVGAYAERMFSTNPEPMKRLEPARALLIYAHKQKWTASNLSVHLRIKKTSVKSSGPAKHNSGSPVCLTDQGYADLTAELSRLKAERPRIADELEKARADRDFRENAPLDAAREHQAQVEARIRELEATMKSATIMAETQRAASRISMGDTVWLQDLSSGEEMCYTLVSSREANPLKGKISTASPTGKILVGKTQGETIDVAAPAGSVRYSIKKVAQRGSIPT